MTDVDVVLRGGTVYTGAGGPPVAADVAIAGDRVVAMAPALPLSGRQEIDCASAFVLPGLIDLHSHLYIGGRDGGVDPDEAHLGRGVVAVNDSGSAGSANFAANLAPVVAASRSRVTGYLNVSAIGILGLVGPVYEVSELKNADDLRIEDAVETCKANPTVIRGIKVRLSEHLTGPRPLPFLHTAIEVAERAGLPVMVHIGDTACGLDDILDVLRAGDVVTHCFHGKAEGMVADGGVIPAAWRARERGVLFDVGHGTSQFAYGVARVAIAAGFFPDTISSDLARHNRAAPAYDLVTVVSKLVALGLPLDDAVPAVTATPARVLGLAAEGYGVLATGGLACATVLRRLPEPEPLPDSNNPATVAQLPVHRFEPTATVHKGELVPVTAWSGHPAS